MVLDILPSSAFPPLERSSSCLATHTLPLLVASFPCKDLQDDQASEAWIITFASLWFCLIFNVYFVFLIKRELSKPSVEFLIITKQIKSAFKHWFMKTHKK